MWFLCCWGFFFYALLLFLCHSGLSQPKSPSHLVLFTFAYSPSGLISHILISWPLRNVCVHKKKRNLFASILHLSVSVLYMGIPGVFNIHTLTFQPVLIDLMFTAKSCRWSFCFHKEHNFVFKTILCFPSWTLNESFSSLIKAQSYHSKRDALWWISVPCKHKNCNVTASSSVI